MNQPLQNIAIIGGGIGGLNLAQALKTYKPSLHVTVYERNESPSSRPQGFHIGINQWGRESLEAAKIGGIDEIFERNTVTAFTVMDQNLSEMLAIGGPVKPGQKPSKLTTFIIDRSDLRSGLEAGVNIEYNKKFVKYEEQDDKIKIYFEDGSSVDADFMVGADGSWSKVRAQFTPSIKYETTGIVSFGTVMKNFSPEEMPTLNKYLKYSMVRTSSPLGYSALMGLCNSPSGQSDLFFGLSFPESIISEPLPEGRAESLQFIKNIVKKEFHPEVALIAERVEENNVLFDGFFKTRTTNYQAENPLAKVPHKRLTLLGDAAHGKAYGMIGIPS
jgi:2-polyprenyl-6-methoxyphenol hydroxylase-like FAD-dependent oxidoreductase